MLEASNVALSSEDDAALAEGIAADAAGVGLLGNAYTTQNLSLIHI